MFRLTLFAMLFCGLLLAQAAKAQNLFWDPQHPGEGWSFENQDDVIAVTRYTYSASGTPIYQIAALSAGFRSSGGYIVAEATGSLLEVTGVNQTRNLGALSGTSSYVGGVEIINVSGPGFTRRLEPFVFNFSEQIDRFNGVWISSIFAVDGSDAQISILQFTNEIQSAPLANGSTVRVKFFRSLSTGQEGFVGFDPGSGLYFTVDDSGDGGFFITALATGNETAFGEGAFFTSAGVQVSPTYAVVAASPAPTTRSGNVFLQFIGKSLAEPTRAASPAKQGMSWLTNPAVGQAIQTLSQSFRRGMLRASQEQTQ